LLRRFNLRANIVRCIRNREAIDPSATALRALKVLGALAQSRDALSATEVADIIGVERSTAYRMLMTLMELAKWCAISASAPAVSDTRF
jgi:IclR helix-turn-helix domain